MPAGLTSGPRIRGGLSREQGALARGPFRGPRLPAAPWSVTWPAPGATLDLDFANDRGFVRGVGQGRSMDAVTFTRASGGTYVDQAGVVQTAGNNEPRFDWAATAQVAIQNTLTSSDAFGGFSTSNANLTSTTELAPDGTNSAYVITASANGGAYTRNTGLIYSGTYVFSLWVKRISGTGSIRIAYRNGFVESIIATSSTWTRFQITGTDTFLNCGVSIGLNGDAVAIWHPQHQAGSTATDYVSVGAQLPTNTPLAAASTCNGLLIEEQRTNRLLWCRDATQSAWTKTNVTPALDQTGIDGAANAASSLTATADGGTCIQTITLASGSRTGSVYLKRLTGTGNVQVSLDGTTWSTVDLSSTEWRRIVLAGTVTNPVVGIRLATNGDAVAMDYGQVEDGAFATTPILTTTATATRSGDLVSMPISAWDELRQPNWAVRAVVVRTISRAVGNIVTTPINVLQLKFDNSAGNAQLGGQSGDVTLPTSVGEVAVAFFSGSGEYGISALGAVNTRSGTAQSGTPVSGYGTQIGGSTSSSDLNGCLKRLTRFPFRITRDGARNLARQEAL